MNRYDVEQVYQEFWKDIICDDDGNIDVEQLKKELCDFYVMIQEVPKVYYEVTDGTLSKCLYDAETVLRRFRDQFARKACAVDYLEDDWDLITAECETNEDYKKAIFEYFEIGE
jgi:hypothetical protein